MKGDVMAARLWIIARTPGGEPVMGLVQRKPKKFPSQLGQRLWREYRDDDDPFTAPYLLQVIGTADLAGNKDGLLCVVWSPGKKRDKPYQAFLDLEAAWETAGVIRKSWRVDEDVDGTLLCTQLEAATGPAASAAKAVWPSTWRKLLPTDPQGNAGTPPGPPTGAMFIREVIA